MKSIEEILKAPRFLVFKVGDDGGMGYVNLLSSKKNGDAAVVFSYGGGWDHVSVSFSNRMPTWDEMCEIKRMFFYPDEVCVQYHPSESEYVNQHKYCLHLWRSQTERMPTPPSWMVGIKKGEILSEVYEKAEREMQKHDRLQEIRR